MMSAHRRTRGPCRIVAALSGVAFVLASCSLLPGDDQVGSRPPTQGDSCPAVLVYALVGITAVEDDAGRLAVRLRDGSVLETGWPRGTSTVRVDDTIEIRRNGELVAYVGDPLDMGGSLTTESLDICDFKPHDPMNVPEEVTSLSP